MMLGTVEATDKGRPSLFLWGGWVEGCEALEGLREALVLPFSVLWNCCEFGFTVEVLE